MRELILLRHAHAEPAPPGQDDHARPLSAIGRREAAAAGDWLRAHALLPERVLCSTAQRARETWEGLGALDCVDVREEPAIYDATPGMLYELAESQHDVGQLLLVGHNPGLEQLVALLHSGQTGHYRGMPPGSIAVLEFPEDAAMAPGAARLSWFWWP